MKLVQAIRKGYIKTKSDLQAKPRYYNIWEKDLENSIHVDHFPAPKLKLPHHNESYNPPKEYLLTPGELKKWMSLDPEDRKPSFLPQKFFFFFFPFSFYLFNFISLFLDLFPFFLIASLILFLSLLFTQVQKLKKCPCL